MANYDVSSSLYEGTLDILSKVWAGLSNTDVELLIKLMLGREKEMWESSSGSQP